MDTADLNQLDWIPEDRKEELKRLMAEWTGPGRNFVLVVIPPTHTTVGMTYFQPCLATDPKGATN
jgi:hypothetical protein